MAAAAIILLSSRGRGGSGSGTGIDCSDHGNCVTPIMIVVSSVLFSIMLMCVFVHWTGVCSGPGLQVRNARGFTVRAYRM